MRRKTHKIETRQKIDKAARHLFQLQGFHKTTIRQIIEAADVKTGTLYHFYKDKEDVFSNMVLDIFHRVIDKTNELVSPEDSALRLACELSFHLHAITLHPQTAELYVVTYNSPSISAKTLHSQIERGKELFGEQNPNFEHNDFMVRAMFLKGFMQSLSLKASQSEGHSPKFFITEGTQLMLQMHGYSDLSIQQTLEQLDELNIKERVLAAMSGVAMV